MKKDIENLYTKVTHKFIQQLENLTKDLAKIPVFTIYGKVISAQGAAIMVVLQS